MSPAIRVLDQRKLDITVKSRANMLSWRGQFSPELVQYLLAELFMEQKTILDPFCGSGTVLSEALRINVNSIGIDINPAAFILSTITDFFELSFEVRALVLKAANEHIEKYSPYFFQNGGSAIHTIIEVATSARLRQFLQIAALVGCGDTNDFTSTRLSAGVRTIETIFKNFPRTNARSLHLCDDSRHAITLAPEFDSVLTSPPYINVFNYHQNYRPILEHLGWTPLQSASAEIGANRKFRQNRFLTVVQYCLDMSIMLNSVRRRISGGGPAVFILGRESNVLRTPFRNGEFFVCWRELPAHLSLS